MPRTRSESAHRKVLHAALELFAERGIDATSMDAVAEASGVSKATIYKHWTDKDALLLEAMAEIAGLHNRPTFESGRTRADMIAVLAHRPEQGACMRERIMPHFMAYSARNPAFGLNWRKMVMEPPRRDLTRLMHLGIGKGELLPDLDIELSLALLLGPVLYSHIFLKEAPVDPKRLAESIVAVFWKAFGRRAPSPRKRL